MAQDRLGTVFNVRAQRRQHSMTRIAVSIVPDVPQSVWMQAGLLRNDSQSPILKLCAYQFKCKHVVVKKVALWC